MEKPFFEALHDGFVQVTHVSDPKQVEALRADGVLVDEEGYYYFSPRGHPEYELCLEPLGEDTNGNSMFYIAFYLNRISLFPKLMVWIKKK